MNQSISPNRNQHAGAPGDAINAADKLAKADRAPKRVAFVPLEQVTRPAVTTEEAAYYLCRRPQTLRCWSFRDNGPVRPIRVNDRLVWPVAAIKAVLGVSA